ncbi:NHL repeat-containing protein [Thermoanaerobacterium sp. DL9XJH110]|uniref:NHL repeat-containing protein n=1 Tax=Thermoanaerobacterium sp. DL9XJH110 TaxID=3386643 RepID=UPI003BB73F57
MKKYKAALITLLVLSLFLLPAGCGKRSAEENGGSANPPPARSQTPGDDGQRGDAGGLPGDGGSLFEGAIYGIKDENLGFPAAASQDSEGNTYVLDLYSTGGLVKVFDRQGNFRFKFAPQESPEAQPVDVAVDGDGHVYVADLGLKAVFKYGQGKLLQKIQPVEDFHPRSLAVDPEGNLLVLSFDRVYRFSPGGKVSHFGKSGEAEGEFGAAGSEFYVGPSGIAADGRGHIYVADTLNNRVQEFDSEGNFVKAFPMGEESPQDVAVNDRGEIYVITSSPALKKLTAGGKAVKVADFEDYSSESTGFLSVAGGYGGAILVAFGDRHQVKVFSGDSEVYAIKGGHSGEFIYPHNLEVFEDRVLAVGGDPYSFDNLNNRVVVFDKTGRFESELLPGYGSGGFFGPRDAVFLKDKIYLLDLDIISVYDRKAVFLTSFGGRGENPGDFGVLNMYGIISGPAGMAAGPDGYLYVSDTYNDRIQKISPGGRYSGGFEVKAPGAIAADKKGKIYVVLPEEARVAVFSAGGKKLLEFGGPGEGDGKFAVENGEGDTRGPDGIAVDGERGLIYVSDTLAHRIEVFDMDGNFVKSIGGFGTGQSGFYFPRDLAVDDEGFLWVADSGNHRIVKMPLWRK